jgi:hypothetical protein
MHWLLGCVAPQAIELVRKGPLAQAVLAGAPTTRTLLYTEFIEHTSTTPATPTQPSPPPSPAAPTAMAAAEQAINGELPDGRVDNDDAAAAPVRCATDHHVRTTLCVTTCLERGTARTLFSARGGRCLTCWHLLD